MQVRDAELEREFVVVIVVAVERFRGKDNMTDVVQSEDTVLRGGMNNGVWLRWFLGVVLF